jgi:outer membrane protein OmpA-like peptidoglycan-associated protein
MLAAIQDFIRDSFAEKQALDSLRLGELRVWSEPGAYASLVAVIRGSPPEELHETFRDVLLRIHTERREALENFDGDSSTLSDIQASLTDCVQLRREARPARQAGFARVLIVLIMLAIIGLLGTWAYQKWRGGQMWEGFLARLRTEPGIVITENGERNGKWLVGGLRDPLAVDPQLVLRESSIDPTRVVTDWRPYQSLHPDFVLKRAQEALAPPATVTLSVKGDRIVAVGSAPSAWIERARASGRMLSAGVFELDLSRVYDLDADNEKLWQNYVARLRTTPGIAITDIEKRDGKWLVRGLRDPLALDPKVLLEESSIEPDRVVMHWEPYQSLYPEFVLKRAQDALAPPPTVTLAIEGDRIVAVGSASLAWLRRARASAFPVELSKVRDVDDEVFGKLRAAIQSKEVRFLVGNQSPAPGQEATLEELARELKELTTLSAAVRVTSIVTVTGHADSTGHSLHNMALSLARAEAVRTALKQRGVDPDLLTVRSVGTLEPRQDANTEIARTANRRVSFTVLIDK